MIQKERRRKKVEIRKAKRKKEQIGREW